MRKTALTFLTLALAAFTANAQEGYKNSATVSATGSFQQDTNGNGLKQSANETPGILFTFDHFFTAHQGVEVNYGFRRLDEQFTPTTSAALPGLSTVTANTHEANASYILRFPLGHRLTPFVSAGVGALVFSPNSSFAVNNVSGSNFATPDFVYSAGFNLALNRRLDLRLGYRGHVFQAPDFGVPALGTSAVTHMAEPFGGLSFHF